MVYIWGCSSCLTPQRYGSGRCAHCGGALISLRCSVEEWAQANAEFKVRRLVACVKDASPEAAAEAVAPEEAERLGWLKVELERERAEEAEAAARAERLKAEAARRERERPEEAARWERLRAEQAEAAARREAERLDQEWDASLEVNALSAWKLSVGASILFAISGFVALYLAVKRGLAILAVNMNPSVFVPVSIFPNYDLDTLAAINFDLDALGELAELAVNNKSGYIFDALAIMCPYLFAGFLSWGFSCLSVVLGGIAHRFLSRK